MPKVLINDDIVAACEAAEEETCCRRCKKSGVHLRIDERFIPLCHECYDDPATHNLWGGCPRYREL
jgi:hypothetical protein